MLKSSQYPVGSFYTQYPDAESSTTGTAFPDSYKPATLFGGTWALKWSSEYVYFRTEGTDGQMRTNGLSLDQLEKHWHQEYCYVFDRLPTSAGGSIYFFQSNNNTNPYAIAQDYGAIRDAITDGVNALRSGTFTEPRNRLIRIYKRES